MELVMIAGECLITAVFVASAVGKIRHGDSRFTESVLGLIGVPKGPARAATTAAIAGEIVVAALLTIGLTVPATRPGATAVGFGLALLLLVGFTAALIVAVRAGVRVPCGCFGASVAPPSPRHLARNAVLIAVAATGVVGAGSVAPAALSPDSISAGVVGIVLAIVVITLDDLVTLFRPALSTKTRRYP